MLEDRASKETFDDGGGTGVRGYKGPELGYLQMVWLDLRSLIEKPDRSNSAETLLSVVKRRTNTRFLMMLGV